ncbi:uncharacterized protein [Amphiura filiformis]|uniref:uncharacterized protein n=1 Tax=Amphiura filiformis TaxID=82378 RepID=UPI003B2116FC
MCLHLHQKCDGLPLCPYDYDELDCGNCGARNIYLQPDVPLNFTSPLYPANYPSNLNCKWTFIATETMVILVQVHEFGLERGFDFLTVGNGDVPGENVIGRLTGDIKLKSFTSAKENLWMELTTDKTGNWLGFRLLFSEIKPVEIKDVCKASAFDCGSGFCLDSAAQCDGFIDCVINRNDEKHCSDIQCPGSYPCQKVSGANISTCVNIEEVCDGDIDCSAGDDEIQCDIKRCPTNCECEYQQDILQVICANGWSQATIAGVARTTNAIDLSQNPLTILESSMFEDLPLLEELYFWDVHIAVIYPDAFKGLHKLKILVLVRESSKQEDHVSVHENGFKGLVNVETLYVDDHYLCCHFDDLNDCITLQPQPTLFMCGSLMQNLGLRMFMWVLGTSALIGNVYVLAHRGKEKAKGPIQAKQSLMIANLAVSDCIMGVYMLILASVDAYYGDQYFYHSETWRESYLCRFESFLSLLSSEASVFFITLISVDRLLCLVFPFGKAQLNSKITKLIVGILWAISVILALVPSIVAGPESDFYDLSDVCIGLPLVTRPSSYSIQSSDVGGPGSGRTFSLPVPNDFIPAWYFSIAIFLGLNLVCFLVIFVCYVVIFINVKMVKKRVKVQSNRDEQVKMTIKMAAIVGTDFICWVPIVIMGILSQTHTVVIPLQMYTWSVVFILPINSSLNPYLYTIGSLISDYRALKRYENESSHSNSNRSQNSGGIVPNNRVNPVET